MQKIKLLTFQTEIDKEVKALHEELKKLNSLIEQSNDLLISKGRKKLTASEMPGLLKNPRILLTKKLCEGVTISGMRLSDHKILELLDVTLTPIESEFEKLKGIHEYISPVDGAYQLKENVIETIEEKHSDYARTPEEIEIVESLQAIVDAFDNFQKKVSMPLNYAGLIKATQGGINAYFNERCFHPESVRLFAKNIIKEKQ